MRSFRVLLCLMLTLAFFTPALAAPDTTVQLQQSLAASQEQVNLLQAEIKLVKGYQQDLLSTVYWALGILATIAAVLVGFGWLSNFWLYEKGRTEERRVG